MITKEINTDRFSSGGELASETRKWRSTYESLASKLGELGTEVKVRRTLESDQDIAPHSFVRDAVHDFVFPPQTPGAEEDKSQIIDPTPGYTLSIQDVTREYDETQVRGHVRVQYDDADSRVTFSVTDLMGESELGENVLAEINRVELADSSPA